MAKRNPPNYNLDVSSPEDVVKVLRYAVDAYYESAIELESAWQSKSAGAPWKKVADILERASLQIERALGA